MLFGKKKRRITRLLIVEDEPLVAFDNEYFLTENDYEIVGTVDSVAGAMAKLRDGGVIDLVLVDINLSDGSGMDVARAAHAKDIAVMFVTGACPEGAAEFANGCLSKPYPQRTLLKSIQAVEAALDGKPPKRLPDGFRLFGETAA